MAEKTIDKINLLREMLVPIKISLSLNMTVADALAVIKRKRAVHYNLYITDKQNHLVGSIKLSNLLTSPPETQISQIKDYYSLISATDEDDLEDIAEKFRDYDLLSLPITDQSGVLIGTLEYDDAISIKKKETKEDFEKMAGIAVQEKPYLLTSDFSMAKSRIVWLLVLMISSIFTGEIIANHQNAFLMFPLLISFVPMLMDTGGNCGSQSSTIIIRSLTKHEISLSDFINVIFKEFKISLLVSFALAVTNGALIIILHSDVKIALAVSLSLIATVILAKLLGASLPLLADKIGIDPAAMASPLITTVVDIFSMLIYFQIASAVLNL